MLTFLILTVFTLGGREKSELLTLCILLRMSSFDLKFYLFSNFC